VDKLVQTYEGGVLRILILEDDALVATGLVRAIGYLGHEGVHIQDIEEAQALVRGSADVDVAMIDNGLLRAESGEDFLSWLRRDHPSIKRLLISGLGRPPGFEDDPPHQLFFAKPFGHRELATVFSVLQADTTRGK
jgi:CheY-like chemotaxis protein